MDIQLPKLVDNEYLSSIFPYIWLSSPCFFLGCLVVRAIEGKRQAFNFDEFKSTVFGSILLGILFSSRQIMQLFLDDSKTTMEPLEIVLKLIFAVSFMDFIFYWIHRSLHEVQSLRKYHAVHHRLRANHTVWGGLDENWQETIVIFMYLNAPFLFISVTKEFYLMYLIAGSFQTALMHGTSISFPPRPLVNATFHHTHHKYLTKNYAGAIMLWDYLFGTMKLEGSKVKQDE